MHAAQRLRRLQLTHQARQLTDKGNIKRIVVLNPKGGSGKTTIAINLASYFASRQQRPVLMDFDPQGSSVRWVRKRQPAQPPIQVIAAFEKDPRTTRAFQLRLPENCTHVIVDTPAAVDSRELPEVTRDAHKIIVPVLPSDIDIHTCSRTIRDLLLVAKIRREDNRLGVIANRIRRNTLTYQALIRFLQTLGIPIVATIRDSQNYVRAAEQGIGVHEMKSYIAHDDVEQWAPLIEWIEGSRGSPEPVHGPSAPVTVGA
ncbi:MAG TPA: ParA family protein [Steroidobacteraceae bacterium]|nr:ParA family protein [Steroidobacteraceae bacterium]